MPLFEKAGIAASLDEACLKLDGSKSIDSFIAACRQLRFWKREETVLF
jgi:catalase